MLKIGVCFFPRLCRVSCFFHFFPLLIIGICVYAYDTRTHTHTSARCVCVQVIFSSFNILYFDFFSNLIVNNKKQSK